MTLENDENANSSCYCPKNKKTTKNYSKNNSKNVSECCNCI